MKRKTGSDDGRQRLEEAMATLLHNQATFVQNQAAFLARIAETDRVASERFARMEADIATILRVLADHGRVLAEHGRMLEALPEAVRDKIGFKAEE